ncbi:GntR family transcriptional regulator [Streptomyces sp.]|uniref:GntR family transcriptional regulator n=1 Tax=Streptomyces sp. TaxID=1931 RepID=UPI002F40B02E
MNGEAHRVADGVRRAIEAGEYEPGAALPSGESLAEQYGVHRGTVYKAIKQLAAEGYLTITRRHPPVVRERPTHVTVVRDRNVYRDEIGYYFDQNAKDWAAVKKPTRGATVPPPHVSELLGLAPDEMAFTRERLMGPPGAQYAHQLATSYLPMRLVGEIAELGAERPGPGGIYDVLERRFNAPLRWRETISARRPDRAEQTALGISPEVPVLVVTRSSTINHNGRDIVAEVNETRMAAEQFAVSYAVQRDASAAWPRQEEGET